MLTPRVYEPVALRRAIVVGASGFLGHDLVHLLAEQGQKYLALGSREIDLCRPESVDQLTTLIGEEDSLVFLSALTPEKGRDVRTFSRNIAMVTHICAALEKRSCRHFIYISSDAVYSDHDPCVDEQTLVSPKGLYALMHAAREQMLESTLTQRQIPWCIVRPCAVYGPGDTHNAYGPNRFIRTALSTGKIGLFGHGEEERDHVYVEDVSRFLLSCLSRRAEGVFNITSGRSVSFLALAQMIAALSPHPVALEYLPRAVPITHRSFEPALRLKFFPDFVTTELELGLAQFIQAVRDNP